MCAMSRVRRIRLLQAKTRRVVADTADRLYGIFVGNIGRSSAYAPGSNKVERKTRFMPGDEPVLLIQGFVHTRGTLNVMESRLRRDGFPVFSLNLAGFLNLYNTRPIEEIAASIAGKIERMMERHSLQRLSIIGHSMGGLVSRYYIQKLGGHRQVKTLITLGSPHNGTPTALLAAVPPLSLVTVCGKQMLPNSSFIKTLAEHPIPTDVKVVSIFSRADLVCPYRYSVIEPRAGERVRNLCVDGIGHTSLLHSERVYRLIRRELEQEVQQAQDEDEQVMDSAESTAARIEPNRNGHRAS